MLHKVFEKVSGDGHIRCDKSCFVPDFLGLFGVSIVILVERTSATEIDVLNLLVATWMALPMFPLNPVEQDTLNAVNLHVTAGFTGPNELVNSGLQLTGKYELMVHHPFVIRGAAEYGYNAMDARDFPNGDIHSMLFALEGLYYRGTDHMTGFIGAGVLLYKGYVSLGSATSDSLFESSQIVDLSLRSKLGFRILLGLRFSKVFSLEVAMTEVRPTMITTQRVTADRIKETSHDFKMHTVRVTLGYLFTLVG